MLVKSQSTEVHFKGNSYFKRDVRRDYLGFKSFG